MIIYCIKLQLQIFNSSNDRCKPKVLFINWRAFFSNAIHRIHKSKTALHNMGVGVRIEKVWVFSSNHTRWILHNSLPSFVGSSEGNGQAWEGERGVRALNTQAVSWSAALLRRRFEQILPGIAVTGWE